MQLREVKEGYSYGYDWPGDDPPENPLQGPNAWPNAEQTIGAGGGDEFDAVEFRTTLNDVYTVRAQPGPQRNLGAGDGSDRLFVFKSCYRVSQAIASGLATALENPGLLDGKFSSLRNVSRLLGGLSEGLLVVAACKGDGGLTISLMRM